MPVPTSSTAGLRAALTALADAVAALRFDLAGPTQAGDRMLRDRVEGTIRRYLHPRLANPDGPIVAALVGSTGSGKSTILNSLAGADISRAGALRPTTGRPVVWRHRAGSGPEFGDLEVDTYLDDHPLLRSLILVDTPDIDSQVAGHRRLAEAVVGLADVAVFVTTPQRYADAVPWEVLGELRRRDIPVVMVLNRAGRRSRAATIDLARFLDRAGISPEGGVHEIQEQPLRGEQRLLPRSSLRGLQATLEELAAARESVTGRAVAGAIEDVLDGTRRLLSALERQAADAEELMSVVRKEHEAQLEHVRTRLQHGELVRADVLERWWRLAAGTGGASRLGQALARIGATATRTVGRVRSEARDELARLVLGRLAAARRGVGTAWALHSGSDELLPLPGDTVDPGEVAEAVDGWVAALADHVRPRGRGRHRIATALPGSLDVAAAHLLVATFALAPGSSIADPETAFETVGGDTVTSARAELVEIVAGLLDRQAELFTRQVRELLDGPRRVLDLIAAVDAVEEVR